jgi:hypothetical protein
MIDQPWRSEADELIDAREQTPAVGDSASQGRADSDAISTAMQELAAGSWQVLSQEQTRLAWEALTGWVDWLRDRYDLHDTITSCWHQHGSHIEELTALRLAWIASYAAPSSNLTDPADWHDRLSHTLRRLKEWNRAGCTNGRHIPTA